MDYKRFILQRLTLYQMDSISEQSGAVELPQKEIVRLNKDFVLFDPERTEPKSTTHGVTNFHSYFYLDGVSDLPQLPFRVSAEAIENVPQINAFTPFNPEIGYQLSQEDFDLGTRIDKVEKITKESNPKIDFAKAPLGLFVLADLPEFDQGLFRIHAPDRDLFEFKPEVHGIIKRLKLLLSFPTGTFESTRLSGTRSSKRITFEFFQPVDAPDLPTAIYLPPAPYYTLVAPGLDIFMPSDQEKLGQIRARFILLPEEDTTKS